MKKILLFICVSCGSLLTFSQSGLHAGLNLGLNSTWILNQNNYGYSEMDYDLKFGIYSGLALGYNFNANNGVQIEINYAAMGQNYFDRIRDFGPTDGMGRSAKVDTYRFVKLNYLQVLVMYRFQTKKEKKDKIELHAMVGPVIGLLLSADQYYEADTADNGTLVALDYAFVPEPLVPDFAATSEVEEPIEYFSKLDMGIQLDVGVDIYINENIYLTPAVKFYYGFTDINTEPTRDALNYAASNNAFAGISIGIHYLMPKGKK